MDALNVEMLLTMSPKGRRGLASMWYVESVMGWRWVLPLRLPWNRVLDEVVQFIRADFSDVTSLEFKETDQSPSLEFPWA